MVKRVTTIIWNNDLNYDDLNSKEVWEQALKTIGLDVNITVEHAWTRNVDQEKEESPDPASDPGTD